MRIVSVVLLSAACVGPTGSVTAPTDGTDPITPIDSGIDNCRPDVVAEANECAGTEQLSSTVSDSAGAPLGGATIRFCRDELCQVAVTDQAGFFCIGEAIPGWHAFEVRGPRCTDTYQTAYVPVEYAPDQQRTVNMVVPDVGTPIPLPATATEVEAAPGLFVTVADGDLITPQFEEDATDISGARLAPAQFPDIDLPGTPLAVWYLSPFEYETTGLPVRFTNDLGVAEGTTLEVWIGSYKEQNWLSGGTVTATAEWLEGSGQIPVTSTVVLIQPDAPAE